jgi:hypothetical protein
VLAEEVAVVADRFPGVEANADVYRLLGAVVAGGEGLLQGDGAAEAVAGGREGDHEAVAHGLHDVPVVGGNLALDNGAVLAQERHPGGVAEALVQRR